jgi:hypothetical protein
LLGEALHGRTEVSIPDADPFGESRTTSCRRRLSVLGCDFRIESSDRALIDLCVDAFGGIPRHRFAGERTEAIVRLQLTQCGGNWSRKTIPPAPTLSSGSGLLCATLDAGNFCIIDPDQSRAFIGISSKMLRLKYIARHELIEIAFYTLASRIRNLIPLHAASFGIRGQGLILMGASGTGKSTLCLHALAQGLQVLSEDAAFIEPHSRLITGVPNYLHLLSNTLDSVTNRRLVELVKRSPIIERRSGARKFEVDLRTTSGNLANEPLRYVATVILSRQRAEVDSPLRVLAKRELIRAVRREQPYATGQKSWREFERSIVDTPAFELRRSANPTLAIDAIRGLLGET